MNMNKKGMSSLVFLIVGFGFMSVIYLFMALFVFDVGGTYLINPAADIGLDIINDNTVSVVNASVSAGITDLKTDYENFNFPFDLGFFLIWIIMIIQTIVLSSKAAKSGIFEFFGLLFMGTMFLLVITSYTSDFLSWFLSNFYEAIFDTSTISTPFFNWYITNLGIVNFIWWISLLLINIVDRIYISRTGEIEE